MAVIIAATGLLALLAFGVLAQGSSDGTLDGELAHGIHPMAPAANYAMPGLYGGRKSLLNFRGRILVVNLFAHWCGPCVAEASVLERLQRSLSPRSATVLGVTFEDDSTAAQAFVRANHITYPVLRDGDGSFAHAFGASGIPETYVIDKQGEVVADRRYQLTGVSWVTSAVNAAARSPTKP